MGKSVRHRCVCAPHKWPAGTATAPRESVSMRRWTFSAEGAGASGFFVITGLLGSQVCERCNAVFHQPVEDVHLVARVPGGAEGVANLDSGQASHELSDPLGVGARHITAQTLQVDAAEILFWYHQ